MIGMILVIFIMILVVLIAIWSILIICGKKFEKTCILCKTIGSSILIRLGIETYLDFNLIILLQLNGF